jgi:hypothetical protein
VTTITGRRAARSALSFGERLELHDQPDLLDEHPDGAAAGQPDIPGGLVGDAEFQHFRLAALDHVERLGHHRALDAAAGDRAEERAVVVDDEAGARPGRGAEPQVSTTVASATPWPAFCQSSAAFRMSSSRLSMGASFQAAERIRLR